MGTAWGMTLSLWLDRDREQLRDILPSDGRFDDLVVGGGLTGLTTALLLARAGRRVGVVEARQVGAVTTGRTTGKLSLLQGTKLSTILSRQPRSSAEVYLDANREGMEWLLRFCDDHGVPYQRREAVTFAMTDEEVQSVRREHDAAASLGLEVRWDESPDLPFPAVATTTLPDQAQIDPMPVLDELVVQFRLHGGTVHEGNRVVSVGDGPSVVLDDGTELHAEHLVLATGQPISRRGLWFAKVEPMRSYALAFTGASLPEGMYLSAGSSKRSLRDAPTAEENHLVVGGAGHVVGRASSTEQRFDELRAWTSEWFPDAKETHAWSAQDYSPYGGVPLVGRLSPLNGKVFVATGFDKWGMTNAVAAAHSISSEILGSRAPSMRTLPFHPGPFLQLARLQAGVGVAMATGFVRSEHAGVVPVAERTVDGRLCRLVGVCTHLGGPLTWNDAEASWDCSLHGSRFAPDGTVLEGPATKPLRPY